MRTRPMLSHRPSQILVAYTFFLTRVLLQCTEGNIHHSDGNRAIGQEQMFLEAAHLALLHPRRQCTAQRNPPCRAPGLVYCVILLWTD